MIDYTEFKKLYPNPRIWRNASSPNYGFEIIESLEFSVDRYNALSAYLLKESRRNNPKDWIKYI